MASEQRTDRGQNTDYVFEVSEWENKHLHIHNDTEMEDQCMWRSHKYSKSDNKYITFIVFSKEETERDDQCRTCERNSREFLSDVGAKQNPKANNMEDILQYYNAKLIEPNQSDSDRVGFVPCWP